MATSLKACFSAPSQLALQQIVGSRWSGSQRASYRLQGKQCHIETAPRSWLPTFSGLRREAFVTRAAKARPSCQRVASPVSARAAAVQDGPAVAEKVEVVQLEDILREKDACGVGYIANLKNEASHKVIAQALQAVGCMEHRGGCSSDNDSGDGAGVMTKVPWELYQDWCKAQGLPALDEKATGVGMLFLPRDAEERKVAKQAIEEICKTEKLDVLGWRPVPVDEAVVGPIAKETMPRIEQLFVKVPAEVAQETDDVERELFIIHKKVDKVKDKEPWGEDVYFCSFSGQTIVHKGMLRSAVLGQFYLDLKNPLFKTSFAIYHRRYSTNTTPRWPLAQPLRFLGHNGEINTLQGNLNWMRSRQVTMKHPIWKGREAEFRPIGDARASDSANLDMAAEVLVHSGRAPEEVMMMLVPEAYKNHPTLLAKYPEAVDFYEYYKGQMEAWDGPALLVFSNGSIVGCCLDRNGLRPARYWRTNDDMVYVASEMGVVDIDESTVTQKGRLGPGMMIVADLSTGEVLENTDVKLRVARKHPYKSWLESSRVMKSEGFATNPDLSADDVLRRHNMFGYSIEDVQMVIENMASQGKEPTFCMGDDIPLAVLSQRPHMLYDYFKQRFAQVTNPAIDPLREGLVMSLEMNVGKRGNILEVGPENCGQVRLPTPILNEAELQDLEQDPTLKAVRIPIFFDASGEKEGALARGLEAVCEAADKALKEGAQLLILSDKTDSPSVDRPAIPTLLAVGTVHHHLIANGLRLDASIVAETAACFSTHHFACLVGYGASAVCPYLALETCRQWRASSKTENLMKRGKLPVVSAEEAQNNYRKAVNGGLKKILSKMGISLLSSYCGAQIFEIYGLGQDVVDTGFKGSVSRIGGLTMDELARESLSFWVKGFSAEMASKLDNFGFIQARPGGEYHGNNPEMSKLLHKAVREKSTAAYNVYQEHLQTRPVNVLRDMFEIVSDRKPISLDEVEPATAIVGRFCTGGMSLGAISRETHEAIAIAMNRLGGKSNSGEGGEDPVRWEKLSDVTESGTSPTLPHLRGLQNGDTAGSAIKQIASGRFGVTPNYLANANQLEIKIAQGAKPGEGGQLPGPKVSPYIAMLRRSKAGVPLISPPPHHDIYSIEDLAQLIYDLHQVNKNAKVSVKLVAEAGIGTVASGVAKANADVIQVSGHDGGTGASPISSIKHAGGPWEMGLTETHQSLVMNGLRERVVVRVDGGLKSGADVMMGAVMGADEYGFGSVAMIATGCIMARICHTNNCPVGVASQREELRARFPGVPGDLVNFFLYVAEEVRDSLAKLGFRSLDEVIGRTDLLRVKDSVSLEKTQSLDLSFLMPECAPDACEALRPSSERRQQPTHSNGPVLDDEILSDPEIAAAIEEEKTISKTYKITNQDRAACGRVSGAIAKKYGDSGFAGQLELAFVGSAGQSFGCFLSRGLHVKVVGECNDYVGKGMGGGEIVVVPSEKATFASEDAVIVGNTCLYGATGGRALINGKAGERFAVRNSLAEAVVEGTGDHCCEYMTGGCIVSLGKVGRNVGAGMTGGLGYFLDEDNTFESKVNKEIVKMQRVSSAAGEQQLKRLIEAHVDKTGSRKGQQVLAKWAEYLPKFWQLVPPSEANSPEASSETVKPSEASLVAGSA